MVVRCPALRLLLAIRSVNQNSFAAGRSFFILTNENRSLKLRYSDRSLITRRDSPSGHPISRDSGPSCPLPPAVGAHTTLRPRHVDLKFSSQQARTPTNLRAVTTT